MNGNAFLAAAIAAGFVLASAGAADAGAGEGVAAGTQLERGVNLRSAGVVTAYRSVSSSEVFENRSTAYFYLTDMQLNVRAARDSRLVITLSAECMATPDTAGEPITAFVSIMVNARTMPSMRQGGRLAFCSSGADGWESHSFQWVSAPVRRPRNTVTVSLARSFGAPGTVALRNKVLTVLHEPR